MTNHHELYRAEQSHPIQIQVIYLMEGFGYDAAMESYNLRHPYGWNVGRHFDIWQTINKSFSLSVQVCYQQNCWHFYHSRFLVAH